MREKLGDELTITRQEADVVPEKLMDQPAVGRDILCLQVGVIRALIPQ